jgi:hypothetical protein
MKALPITILAALCALAIPALTRHRIWKRLHTGRRKFLCNTRLACNSAGAFPFLGAKGGNMKSSTLRCVAATAVLAFSALAVPAQAESIAITYNLTGTGTVVGATDTTLTLDAQAAGSVLSADAGRNSTWNPVSYSDHSVLNLTTDLLNGDFTLTLADGDTLTGTIFEDDTAIDTSPTQTGAFPQTLTFTGGTGEFAGATGSVSGNGFLGTTGFTVSGSGTLNTSAVPEPAPAALLVSGLTLISITWWRPGRNGRSGSRRKL